MNKVYKLMWNTVRNAWVVCSELSKKGKSKSSKTVGAMMVLPLVMTVAGGAMTTANAAECTVMENGSIRSTALGNHNVNGCEISSIKEQMDLGKWGVGIRLYSQKPNTTVTVTEDLKTEITSGNVGLVSSSNASGSSYLDARGQTIDITMQQNPDLHQFGAEIFGGSKMDIGTFNITMNDLIGTSGIEHYGVVAGSSVNAGETETTNGQVSEANFDNLNIKMNTDETGSKRILLAGIRAIQGANKSSGLGSDGIVRVHDQLNIDIDSKLNSIPNADPTKPDRLPEADAVGVYVSGGNSQVYLKDSEIKISSDSTRANAMQIGKGSGAGKGQGQLYSTGEMRLDTTASEKSNGAINIQSQGSFIDANADTSSTTIKTATDGIYVAGSNREDNKTTTTSFNNLTIETAKSTGNLVNVIGGQTDYQLNIRGEDSNLTAADDGYIINVMGSASRPSNVTMNFNDGYMQGLVKQADGSNLQMNVENALWQLAQSGDDSTASFSRLNLNKGYLKAFDQDKTEKGQTSDFVLQGDVVAKNSTIDLQNGISGDHFTIDGNFTTGNNTWLFDSFLTGQGEGKSTTDKVKITGDIIDKGFDWVLVKNLNLADPTGLESILIFDIEGESDGHFLLKDRVVKGNYEYLLNHHSDNGNWYLESVGPDGETGTETPVTRPEVGSYAYNAQAANNVFTHRLEDRVGASVNTYMNKDNVGKLWIRTQLGNTDFKDQSGQVKTEASDSLIHAGIGLVNLGKNDDLNIGVMAAYADANSDSKSAKTKYQSSSKLDGYGLGLYGTWYKNPMGQSGPYTDVWLMWNKFNNQVSGEDLTAEHYDSSGVVASAEVGTSIQIAEKAGRSYWIQPQAQVVYQGVKLDGFTEQDSKTVVQNGNTNVQTRLGAKAYASIPSKLAVASTYRPYVAVNWLNNSISDLIALDGQSFGIEGDRNIAELKLGIEGQISNNSHAWFNIGYQHGDESYQDVIGNLGWKILF